MNTIRAEDRAISNRAQHLYPVILCGGAGKRLWPLSRRTYPKQLLALLAERTLLQETAARVQGALGLRSPIILCNEEHRFLVADQLSAIDSEPDAILCEPAVRNTAPALSAAAAFLHERDPEAIMFALPSDHHVGNVEELKNALDTGVKAADEGKLVTFGIRPTRADTAYGYIERGAALNDLDGAYVVNRFVEKPDRETAERLVADGSYLWNSGMFVFPVAVFLEEIARYDALSATAGRDAVRNGRTQNGFTLLDATAFSAAPDVSVDYAVMERTAHAAVVPADFALSDIGSWRALRDADVADDRGNVIKGDVIADDVRNSYIRSDGGRLVAVVGLDDIVIVDTDDAVLVCDAARCGDVGRIVQQIDRERRPESTHHRRVHRPWGYYEVIEMGDRFQVKHIMVKPGGRLSVQMHHHRAEHWVVIGGTAHIARDEESRLLGENESIFIPLGALHRLENPGRIPLHLIEIQVGAYLGEDDIVRFEDSYGRV